MDLHKVILRKLFRRRIIGGKHTAIEHLTQGIPRHLSGESKTAVLELIRQGLVLQKPTSYGLQVSLNPARLPEIERIINE